MEPGEKPRSEREIERALHCRMMAINGMMRQRTWTVERDDRWRLNVLDGSGVMGIIAAFD